MTLRTKMKQVILQGIDRMDGEPMTDSTLINTVRVSLGAGIPESEIHSAKRELENAVLISGRFEELSQTTSWTLTVKGKHAASQL